ncbi:MAG: type I phosphomannose isomerase catalytic subunit [Chloroflexota bacterium]
MTDTLYPLLLNPSLHVKVWGGRKLETDFGKILPDGSPYGESWELHDTSTVANGVHQGKTLAELLKQHGTQLIGEQFDPAEGLPLLIKLLDATQWLSVQVHPNDEQAKELEGDPRGKTEAWVMLATDPDAQLVIGVTSGTTQDLMAKAIRDGKLEDLLVYENVRAGDVLYLPANTVHAIGPGIVLYEVQQSSNVTYRLYDWNRMGLDGKPRELHIEKGVQVSNLDTLPEITHPDDGVIVSGDYFCTMRYTLDDASQRFTTDGTFHALTCIAGEIVVEHPSATITLQLGQTAMIPASLADYTLSGTGTILQSFMM